MKGISVAGAALLLAGAVMNARAETVQGQLELAWGDPLPVPGAPRSAQLHATLLTDNGVRLSLDAAQAKAAAA